MRLRKSKILAGAEEALEVSRGNLKVIEKIKVTPSCGCVFCDVGLFPHDDGIHRANGHEVKCAVFGIFSPPADTKGEG